MVRVTVFIFVTLFNIYQTEQAYFLTQAHIDSINKVATTWKAGMNFDPDTPKKTILGMLGSKGIEDFYRIKGQLKTNDPNHVPDRYILKYFDARKRWRNCPTISEVRDQGNCGSSWAFSSTGAFADRLCIATKGKFKRQISAEHLTFCCEECGYGCGGGYLLRSWQYFTRHGVVSGGGYNTSDGCQPYQVKPCSHYYSEDVDSCPRSPRENNHECRHECYGDNSIKFDEDRWKTRNYYFLNYDTIQKDVQTYGPVESAFWVCDDFLSYKSGVYEKTENATVLGLYSVKMIGWGIENGIDYWLMLGSWGTSWGDNGMFKIRKGTGECFVDTLMSAGVPEIGPNS